MTDEPGSELDQAANLLGALSLLITDQMTDAMAEAGGRPESGAAALSALLHFLDQPTVDLLRQVLGLTSSGTVRLIDRMAESGYVQRGPGADGRSTSVSLTPAGRAAAARVAAARAGVLTGALDRLSPAERETLRALLSKLLAVLIPGPGRDSLDLPAVRHRSVPRRGERLPGRERGPRALRRSRRWRQAASRATHQPVSRP